MRHLKVRMKMKEISLDIAWNIGRYPFFWGIIKPSC